jgi:hypothetical protein
MVSMMDSELVKCPARVSFDDLRRLHPPRRFAFNAGRPIRPQKRYDPVWQSQISLDAVD